MREIKFRAWSISEHRMINLATSESSSTHLQLNNHAWGVFEPDAEDYCGGCSCNKLSGDILMQYTGINDKNEKEIYEGDIIKYSNNVTINGKNEHVSQVEFRTDLGGYCFGMVCIGYGTINDAQVGLHKVEVIGNIYENPELIGE